ncbi:hypothetical protein ACFX2J_005224 [Malus domestica]|uniref:protein S40-4-like n=1 Tax=Malus domestica TaxID=3750 RepID=UPI0039753071
MADWSGMMSKSSGFGGGRNGEDFEEEERENSSLKMLRNSKNNRSSTSSSSSSSSSSASACRLPTAARTIPWAHNDPPADHEVQKSAPVAIPDWSKIYGKGAKIGSSVHDDDDVYGVNGDGDGDGGVIGDGDDDDMVPPHEWVARKLARSQISSFSVYEGIGRTLKGRDLSKVRNAVLTKTGFLE